MDMVTVTRSHTNASVVLVGMVMIVVSQIALVTQIVTIVVTAVQQQLIQLVFVMLIGQGTHVTCHVSMELHSQTSPVYVILVILELDVTSCVEDMDHVTTIPAHVMKLGGVGISFKHIPK